MTNTLSQILPFWQSGHIKHYGTYLFSFFLFSFTQKYVYANIWYCFETCNLHLVSSSSYILYNSTIISASGNDSSRKQDYSSMPLCHLQVCTTTIAIKIENYSIYKLIILSPTPLLSHLCPSTVPSPLATTSLFSIFMILSFGECYINRII